jgi:sugar phosphate isomerase/epimerase
MSHTTLKNAFPFRLGTTSFILPAGYGENVAFLAPLVDDVELLFFESSGPHFLPEEGEVEELARLKREHGLSYTLHLPLDLHPGSGDEALRRASLEAGCRLARATAELEPLAWILHVPAPEACLPEALERSIRELESAGVARPRLCLENLDFPWRVAASLALRHGLSWCLDVGHLLRYGFGLDDLPEAELAHCRVVHLHGLQGEHDHREISLLAPDLVGRILDLVEKGCSRDRVVTLEVFGREPLFRSLAALEAYRP